MREIIYQKRTSRKAIVIGVFAGIILVAALIVFGLFRVQEIVISGNQRYTAAQIQESIMRDGLCKNTLYMIWKYKNKSKAEEALPFLSAVEVEMLAPYKVQVRVYEKTETGYLAHQGSNVYFDQEGMVVENSREIHDNVPLITGVTLKKSELYESLAVEDEGIFDMVIDLTRTLNKNDLIPDEIRFDEDYKITLLFSGIKVMFGTDRMLDDKVAALKSIFPKLSGMSGTLYMENYSSDTRTITFKKGDLEEEIEVGNREDGDDSKASDDDGSSEDETGTSTVTEAGGTFSTDENGDKFYTDPAGNITYNVEQYTYTDENGNIIDDGYGYIDPYTGAYIIN